MLTIPKRIAPRNRELAFNRIELLLVIVLVFGLGVLAYALILKTRTISSTSYCASNLKQIGRAVQMYANVNAGKIPYAFIHYSDKKQVTWDTLIGPFLLTNQVATPKPGGMASQRLSRILSCPSDGVQRLSFASAHGLSPRTYSMASHSMDQFNWPVSSTNATGAGLWWADFGGKYSSLTNVGSNGILPAVHLSYFSESAFTILITEQAKSNNISRNSSGARIKCTAEHLDEPALVPSQYHHGKINYLMADMHVETLNPKATVGHTGQAGTNVSLHYGMWTIRAGD